VDGITTIFKKKPLYAHKYTSSRATRQPCLRKHQQNVTLPDIPLSSHLISVRTINDTVIQQLGSPHTDKFFPQAPPATPQSWDERLADKTDNWMIQEVHTTPECQLLLAESIRRGNAIGVTDGSYCPIDKRGSSGAVVHCQTTGLRMKAANMVPGHPDDQSSHRSELAGRLALMNLLQMLHEEHDLTNGSFTFGLDNAGARFSVMSQVGPKVSKANYDMILDIRKRKATIPITFSSVWIKGHQDDTNKYYSMMDIWTLLNIEMDKLPGEYYQQHKEEEHPNVPMANEPLTVWIDDEKLSCFDKQKLYNQVFARTGRTETDKSA